MLARLRRFRPKLRVWFTRRALAAACAILAVTALGAAWAPFVGVAVALSIAFAGALAADLLAIRAARVRVARVPAERFVLGVPAVLAYDVRNLGAVDVDVTIVERAHPLVDVGETGVRVRVAAQSSARAELPVVPRERGDAPLARLAYRAVTKLGLIARTADVDAPAAIRVWPDLSILRRGGALAQRRQTIDAGLRRLRLRGAGTDFESLREYATGDAFRDVAWRATARRGKPIVVTRTIERSQDVVLVLDSGRLMLARTGAERKFDYALAAALTLAGAAAREGDRVGLLAFAGGIVESIPVRGGRAHAAALAERIHALQPRYEEADYEGALAYLGRRQSKRALIVLFTDVFDPVAAGALVAHLGSLARRHLVVVVLLADDALREATSSVPASADGAYRAAVTLGLADDRRRAIAVLERLRVITIDVAADQMSLALVNRYIELKARGAL